MVVSDDSKGTDLFRLPKKTAARLRRLALEASLAESKRVTYGALTERALDALERELAAGKAAPRKRGKG